MGEPRQRSWSFRLLVCLAACEKRGVGDKRGFSRVLGFHDLVITRLSGPLDVCP